MTNILDYIDKMQEMYEGKPSSTVQESRNMFADGQLVQPNADGSRPGYAGEKKLTKTMEKRIVDYESKTGNKYKVQPNWRKKDIRDGNWTGGGKGEKFKDPAFIKAIRSEGSAIQQVRDYLNNSLKQNKGKPVVFKTIPEIKKLAGVTSTGKGIDGDISRALTGMFKDKVLLRNFDKLPNEIIDGIKTDFSDIISKDQWNFNKYKFGINKEEFTEKVYDRIRAYVQDPKPTRYGFGFNKPEGWMLVQMDRAWRSGNKNYKPIYRTDGKVIGYKDNTASGQGKKWFVSKDYIKGKNSDGLLLGGGENYDAHLDFAENKKYHDIVQKAGKQPNRAITQILKDGGIDQKVQLRHIVNYLLDNSDLSTTKNSIVRHHRGSLQNATQDLQILNRVQNAKVIGIEKRIKDGIIKPDDIAKLNRFGVSVRDPNTGTLYGKGPTTAKGGLKKINELVLKGSTNKELYGKDIKGLQDFKKKDFNKLNQYLSDLGCPKSLQKASGGRIKYSKGTSCPIKGGKIVDRIIATGKGTKEELSIAKKILNFGKESVSLRGLFGPQATALFALTEAGLTGYDVAKGKPLKEAIGKNLNYLLGPKWEQDVDELEYKRLEGSGVDINQLKLLKNSYKDFEKLGELFNTQYSLEQNKGNPQGRSGMGSKGTQKSRAQRLQEVNSQINDMYMAKGPQQKSTLIRATEIQNDPSILANRKNAIDILAAQEADRSILPEAGSAFADERRRKEKEKQRLALQTTDKEVEEAFGFNPNGVQTFSELNKLMSTMPEYADQSYGITKVGPQTGQYNVKNAYNEARKYLDSLKPEFGYYGTQEGANVNTRYAGGGIARLSGGDTSGPPPESGPMSQGLRSLYKNGRKL
jgi:hypothetical protein